MGCLYMDSFPSGEGKSRTAIGHAMRMAVPYRWNNEVQNFIDTVIWEKRYSPQNAVQWFSENQQSYL